MRRPWPSGGGGGAVAPKRNKHRFAIHCTVRSFNMQVIIFNGNPRIRDNWNGEPSGYAQNPDNWIFFLIVYIGNMQLNKYLPPAVVDCIFIYIQVKHMYIIHYMYLAPGGGVEFKPLKYAVQ